ncbi:serine hydrolase domain-containing protein [Pseudaestuariivita rosea]|uniref:serine hydrolase domain-containing protein n=1 Tax=Pseudaestuariivita rosea TaxID=2763263 RepID=UPI001ABB964F|nr:serine hydrolase [Pseudaestuariivita rosea]
MRNLKRFLGICLVLAIATAGGLLAFAPQVPILMREGFPPDVWTDNARYAHVEGVNTEYAIRVPEMPAIAQTRFDAAGGRAMLVDQGGTVIYESYGQGFGPEDRLNSFSMVKSLVGALIIRALADDRIASLDDPLSRYLGPDAPDVTINEALTMTSGLLYNGEPPKSVDDAGFSPLGPLARLHVYGIDAVLPDLAVDPAAKGQFAYQSVNTALLGAVLEATYDQPLSQILSDLIWKPAGAATADWRAYSKAEGVSAYCCLYARAEDWLRVGRYLLNNGTPADPFLPEDLWRDLILPQLEASQRRQGAYGWHLRHDVLDRDGEKLSGPFAYFMGHGGQILYLLPDHDIVVVRFGARPQLLHSTLYEVSPPD